MKLAQADVVTAALVRRAVVEAGDIEGDVRFQNDINCLLAQLDEKVLPLEALGWMTTPVFEGRSRQNRNHGSDPHPHGLHIVEATPEIVLGEPPTSRVIAMSAGSNGGTPVAVGNASESAGSTPPAAAATGAPVRVRIRWPAAARPL